VRPERWFGSGPTQNGPHPGPRLNTGSATAEASVPALVPIFQVAGMSSAGSAGKLDIVVLRCLIVDDSPRFLYAARGLLERQGITVVGVTANGAEALRRAQELRPDVTLVDIDLGGESGFEVARRLHGDGDAALSRVILVSTHAEEDYVDLIAASPAIGFLAKTDLSGSAIRDLLATRGDGSQAD
jgi:CheY-like chemotaxis protein